MVGFFYSKKYDFLRSQEKKSSRVLFRCHQFGRSVTHLEPFLLLYYLSIENYRITGRSEEFPIKVLRHPENI